MSTDYDFVIAGAGISAAAFAASLKHLYRICIVDTRSHIGGNCYDYKADSKGTRVHMYGPHYFHTSNMDIVNFLSNFTEWREYEHSVSGEIEWEGQIKRVPFPYSLETAKVIGRELTEEEVIEKFFKGYSEKMWGVSWDQLSSLIKNRVPKNTNEKSVYFPNQFSALPTKGYTHMIENMIDGCDVLLSANEETWKEIPAKHYVYCGRPDYLVGMYTNPLDWRNIEFEHKIEDWDSEKQVVNFCHKHTSYTRKTSQGLINGTDSKIVTYETPTGTRGIDYAPFYPVLDRKNQEKITIIKDKIQREYPKLTLLGRLGVYKYLDMHQAVGLALKEAEKFKE